MSKRKKEVYSNDVYEFKKVLRDFMQDHVINLMSVVMEPCGAITIHGATDKQGTLIEDVWLDVEEEFEE